MVNQRKTRRRNRQQHGITRIFSRFERQRIDRFKRQAFKPDNLKRQTVARQYRVFVDLRRVRKMIASRRFATRKFLTGGKHLPPRDDGF